MNDKRPHPSYLKKVNDSVFQHEGKVFTLTEEVKIFLRERASASSNRRARICLHKTAESCVQEMIIAMCQNTEIPIHRHDFKRESLAILDGQCNIMLYGSDGTLEQVIYLKSSELISIPPKTFHSLCIKSEYLILHETAEGPFNQSSTKLLK